jgi:hypothetical protein
MLALSLLDVGINSPTFALLQSSIYRNSGLNWGLGIIIQWFLVVVFFNVAIETCVLKAFKWGSWWVCFGDVILLNALSVLVIHILASWLRLPLSIPDMTVITILVKGCAARLLSDQSPRKSWLMPVVTTAALYIFYTFLFTLIFYVHWR